MVFKLAGMIKYRRAIWVLPFLLAVAAFSAGVWWLSYRAALDQMAGQARSDLSLAADRLTGQLFRYRELAVVLSEHPVLEKILAGEGNPSEGDALLQAMADKTGARILQLVDRNGVVVAASSPGRESRDVSKAPLARAMYGALGAANFIQTSQKGQVRRLFEFAAPVFSAGGAPRGAVVAEVDVFQFEQNWPTSATAVYFVDATGRVFVTNRSELTLENRFDDEGFLDYRAHVRFGHEIWALDGGPYLPARALHVMRDLPVIDMKAEILLDAVPASQSALQLAAVAAALCLVFGAVLFLATERRRTLADRLELEAEANARLEARVAKRTQALSAANADLRREISERLEAEAALKKAQADLVQAGKLSALGQMSAGISHELNQPLMAIRSFAENGTLFLERDTPQQAARNLARISELARRMGRIIQNLRAFARQESEPITDVDIVSVVDAVLELVDSRLRSEGVFVVWSPPPGPVWVRGGEVRLQQVVMNLITNAADAMAQSDPRRLEVQVTVAGTRMRLSVRDTGPGIDEPEKIFDPFYTTKEVGAAEGMGLGLSISYGLVQSFGGAIRGHNHPEGGAVFTVELDAAQKEAAA